MYFHLINRCSVEPETNCLILPLFEDYLIDINLYKLIEKQDLTAIEILLERGVIDGKLGNNFYLPVPMSSYESIMIVGLGKKANYKCAYMRQAAGQLVNQFTKMQKDHLFLDLELYPEIGAEAFIEGIVLGQYQDRRYKTTEAKTKSQIEDICIHLCESKDLTILQARCDLAFLLAKNTNWARDLGNTPADDLTPEILANICQGLAEETGAEVNSICEDEMKQIGMNSILTVSKGSQKPARLIELRYRHKAAKKTIALVGKGITFDSGGLSLKQAKSMEHMKTDMCGAAAVLGAMKNICTIKPAINVVCIIPAAENMCGGAAMKPGDIIKGYNGKTIEVLNTDAEGRLILADALAYTAKAYKPDFMVDLATLTGAAKAALGNRYAAIFSESDEHAEALIESGKNTNELLWRMPLDNQFRQDIRGKQADLMNTSRSGLAGACTAAAFLSEFSHGTPWAHIDIAGTACKVGGSSYLKGDSVSGFGVRLLSRWLLDIAE